MLNGAYGYSNTMVRQTSVSLADMLKVLADHVGDFKNLLIHPRSVVCLSFLLKKFAVMGSFKCIVITEHTNEDDPRRTITPWLRAPKDLRTLC